MKSRKPANLLKGPSSTLVGENTKAFKNAGMNERDATMASLKRTKTEKKTRDGGSPVKSSEEDFPYGTRLELDHETMGKLGMTKLPAVGKKLHIQGHGHITSASEHTREGETPRRSASLQLTHMKLG